jgi:hypothetical protein
MFQSVLPPPLSNQFIGILGQSICVWFGQEMNEEKIKNNSN